MAIPYDFQLSEIQNPESFESLHWMGYKVDDGYIVVDRTGIVLLSLQGGATG